jgi:hypothetical protein
MAALNSFARALPALTIAIAIPERPENVARRDHNRIMKDAMRTVLERHHKERIPGHFEHSAHGKYGYQPRSRKYIDRKVKLGLGGTDLVMTGATKQEMTSHAEFVVGGAAEGGKKALTGKIVLRFAFGRQVQMGYAKRAAYQTRTGQTYSPRQAGGTAGVDLAQMKKEIQAMTAEEKREIALEFRAEYLRGYRALEQKAKEIEYARGEAIRVANGWYT